MSGSNQNSYGGQVPEVLMHYSRLYIYNAVNGGRHTFISNPLTFNKYSRVEISQKPDVTNTSVILFTVKINGKQIHQMINRDARYFPNVKVYNGNPWRHPAKAIIKNLVYKNLPEGGKLIDLLQ